MNYSFFTVVEIDSLSLNSDSHPYLYVKRVRAVREHPARRLALVLGGLELVRYDRGRVGQVGQAAVDPVVKRGLFTKLFVVFVLGYFL